MSDQIQIEQMPPFPPASEHGFSAPEQADAYYRAAIDGQRAGSMVANAVLTQQHLESVSDLHQTIAEKDALIDLKDYQASHDTMVPEMWNKSAFHQILEERLNRGTPTAVLFIDLDEFKSGVNDAHGHDMGDLVIKRVGSKFVDSLRKQDPDNDLGTGDVISHERLYANPDTNEASRFGGDEFAALVNTSGRENKHPSIEEQRLAAKIVVGHLEQAHRDAIREIEEEQGIKLRTGLSIGTAIALPGEDASAVLKRADTAMYEAKKAKPGRKERQA